MVAQEEPLPSVWETQIEFPLLASGSFSHCRQLVSEPALGSVLPSQINEINYKKTFFLKDYYGYYEEKDEEEKQQEGPLSNHCTDHGKTACG